LAVYTTWSGQSIGKETHTGKSAEALAPWKKTT